MQSSRLNRHFIKIFEWVNYFIFYFLKSTDVSYDYFSRLFIFCRGPLTHLSEGAAMNVSYNNIIIAEW